VALQVAVAPQCSRHLMTFGRGSMEDASANIARLAVFEHVHGAKYSQGLFPDYHLPNGGWARGAILPSACEVNWICELIFFDILTGRRTKTTGKSAYFYYTAGAMVEEVAVALPSQPRRPNTIGAALQNVLPMDILVDVVSKPPGPYAHLALREFRPKPPRAPLPDRHTLPVRVREWCRESESERGTRCRCVRESGAERARARGRGADTNPDA
jgi:hypothetical protein